MNKNMLGAMLVGAAIGATLGIILSSPRGGELLKQVVKKGSELADQLSGKIEEGKSLLNDLQKKSSSSKSKQAYSVE
jgi:gas vesicle protein